MSATGKVIVVWSLSTVLAILVNVFLLRGAPDWAKAGTFVFITMMSTTLWQIATKRPPPAPPSPPN